jgi:hypothetical protein
MAKNNLSIWCRENFSVRPEPFNYAQESLVEGWTKKMQPNGIFGAKEQQR